VEIDEALVRHVAQLARLELSADEVHAMAPQLARIFQHVDQVAQLDLGEDPESLDPATQAAIDVAALRDDEPGPTLDTAAILRNAPAHDGAFLVVPRFLGEDDVPADDAPADDADEGAA
jgi:aspartyl-tRNA(Asn)/glutamyl-tRNA(Gln) amidotransferase subunit C